jgi:hypothetical protein
MATAVPTIITSVSGLIYTGPCVFLGYLVGTDGANDPTVTIYNNTSAAGNEVVPTCAYDASQLGVSGATGLKVLCEKGIYVEIACAGATEVVVFWAPAHTVVM